LALGCTVAELQARMSSLEFAEWLAYYRIEPFGEERADARHASMAALIANIFRGKHKAYDANDFMPRFEASDPKPAWQKIMDVMGTAGTKTRVRK
jgi:hypothetical protein